MHKLEKINRKTYFVILSITASILIIACASMKASTSNGQLIIQEQGSFAVGGTIITNPGTFDPIKHGAFNPTNQPSEGQTLHGDHAYVYYAGKMPPGPDTHIMRIFISALKYLLFFHIAFSCVIRKSPSTEINIHFDKLNLVHLYYEGVNLCYR